MLGVGNSEEGKEAHGRWKKELSEGEENKIAKNEKEARMVQGTYSEDVPERSHFTMRSLLDKLKGKFRTWAKKKIKMEIGRERK